MKGILVVNDLKKKLRVSTDSGLSKQLGLTVAAIHYWKKRRTVTSRQIAGLVKSARMASATTVEATAIKPLVEFFRIQKCPSRQRAKYELFGTKAPDGSTHPYWDGLRKQLERHHGVYIFFDSRGQAIYTGKARKQYLWHEMNLAFNRERGDVQKIKRVRHPENKVEYRPFEEKSRQIQDHIVPLHDLAAYFSAYYVADRMINVLEAMLIRSFANDLLNSRMERFARTKKVKSRDSKLRRR